MHARVRHLTAPLVLVCFLAACKAIPTFTFVSADATAVDSGMPVEDSGTVEDEDAAMEEPDGAPEEEDSATPEEDSGSVVVDGGTRDSGGHADAGSDAGPVCVGGQPSQGADGCCFTIIPCTGNRCPTRCTECGITGANCSPTQYCCLQGAQVATCRSTPDCP